MQTLIEAATSYLLPLWAFALCAALYRAYPDAPDGPTMFDTPDAAYHHALTTYNGEPFALVANHDGRWTVQPFEVTSDG
jgi:hypothetical protein